MEVMSSHADTAQDEVLLSLDRKERARIAGVLLRSLDDEPEDEASDEELAEAWNQELARRSAEVASGKVKLVSWGDLRGDARKLLAKRRKK